ncbi:MAG: MopE-related protein [Myxococcota bacterium]
MLIRFWGLLGLLVACDPAADPDPSVEPDPSVDPADPDLTDPMGVDADQDGFDDSVDCDDDNALVFPGAVEVCNEVDDDCDDDVDEGVTTDFYADADQDGFGDAKATPVVACTAPTGTVDNAMDCDDTTAAVSPKAQEVCNGVDDDCAGGIDDGLAFADYYPDVDEDTFGDQLAKPVNACAAPKGWVTNGTDCDDGAVAVYPGAKELCNGIDDDCANGIDDGLTLTDFFPDADQDGYGDLSAKAIAACAAPPGTVTTALDCDDTTAAVSPDAVEVCNGIDDDCAGGADDGLDFDDYYPDNDGDGYGDSNGATVSACAEPEGYTLDATDCDDGRDDVNPGQIELCNGIDDDCANGADDGLIVPRVNLARGATASATNTFSGYSAANLVDGDRSTDLDEDDSWTNSNGERATAEVELDFGGDVTFGRIDVYSTLGYEMQGFTVEYWDGKAWVALRTVTGLVDERTVVTFPAVTSEQLRFSNLEGSVAQSGYARINEIEVYRNQAPDATITASSTFSGYSTAETVDGSRGSMTNDGWTNSSTTLPATIEYDFDECRTFDVFVLTTSSTYEIRDYDIEAWDGESWHVVESVVGNVDVTIESVVDPAFGESVRVVGYLGPNRQPQYVRVNEFEIY